MYFSYVSTECLQYLRAKEEIEAVEAILMDDISVLYDEKYVDFVAVLILCGGCNICILEGFPNSLKPQFFHQPHMIRINNTFVLH